MHNIVTSNRGNICLMGMKNEFLTYFHHEQMFFGKTEDKPSEF
jgi:hypothetical protein